MSEGAHMGKHPAVTTMLTVAAVIGSTAFTSTASGDGGTSTPSTVAATWALAAPFSPMCRYAPFDTGQFAMLAPSGGATLESHAAGHVLQVCGSSVTLLTLPGS
jgi:hypothetical protein